MNGRANAHFILGSSVPISRRTNADNNFVSRPTRSSFIFSISLLLFTNDLER